MKKLNFWFITGLADAESSFVVNIIKDKTRSTGYNIQVSFELNLNHKDKLLLDNIKYTLGIGNIFYNSNDKTYKFKVSNINELNDVIIPHFKKYYLITQKRVYFELFSKIIEILKNKEHLTKQGLQKIGNLKVTLNLGISNSLIENFPETILNKRDIYNNINIPDPNWLSGFSEGESCFYISIYKSEKSKLGLAVQLVFKHNIIVIWNYLKVFQII
jgi:LAGLIDADG endonuclease